MADMIEAPYPLALMLCDATWEDPATGKRTILGSFSYLRARSFPAVYPIVGVYAAITEGRGQVPVYVRLIDVDEERPPLLEGELTAEFQDPREVVELDYHFTGVVFPAPGEYRLQLFAGGEFPLERRLTVIQAKGTYL